ncbi:hypothetical protein NL676_004539 [Syzygium grande]|nr:hypothetical protein NL676_004539 [Syzygium grande]
MRSRIQSVREGDFNSKRELPLLIIIIIPSEIFCRSFKAEEEEFIYSFIYSVILFFRGSNARVVLPPFSRDP